MLGRIIPGRLPSTVADIKLIDQRIAFNRQQLALLPQRVAQGLLSQHDAAYRRLYLEGEIEQLTQAKRNRRYATPSYRTPLDVFESTRRGGAAKKYTPDSKRDSLPEGYFGDDNGKTGGSIPSDWNANNPVDFNVPKLPSQVAFNVGKWPAHWPGSHSSLITGAVMEAGKVGMKQIVDPRKDDTMKLKGLNLVNSPPHMGIAKQVQANYAHLLEIVSANPAFTVTDRTLVNRIYGTINRQITFAEQEIERRRLTRPDPSKAFEKAKRRKMPTNPYPGQSDTSSGDRAPPKPIAPPAPAKPSPSKPSRSKPSPSKPSRSKPSLPSMPGRPSFPSMPGRSGRRTGTLMGLGAMQAHDRNSHLANDGGMTPYERKSYLQAEREMALARKRAGAKVDITKQLREEPITRPWQMQVSLSTSALNAISTQLDQQLASINLSQEMFTQQMHTHVAAVINSMPSGMGPSEQAEMIIEQVMAKVTNSSGLLKKDVKVDINRGSTSPLTFSQAESLSGVVGSLSGTRAALGRLLR